MTLPDGSIYTNGQIKPAWNYIANHLDVAIKDVTVQGQTATNMIQIAAATNFEDAHIYGEMLPKLLWSMVQKVS